MFPGVDVFSRAMSVLCQWCCGSDCIFCCLNRVLGPQSQASGEAVVSSWGGSGFESALTLLPRIVWKGTARVASVTVKQGLLPSRQAVLHGAEWTELLFSQFLPAVIQV